MKPIRRNIAHLSQAERDKLVSAINQLDMTKVFPDGVSYWDKQDQIHQGTHVHDGPSFLSWHRELCNRIEVMLQEVDPDVALHYWDWTTDPRNSPNGSGGFTNLFTSSNFGSSSGEMGDPFDTLDNDGVQAGSREDTGNPVDPPRQVTRNVAAGAPMVVDSDIAIIHTADGLPQAEQFSRFRNVVEGWIKADGSPAPGGGDWNHNGIHGYIGGTIGAPHSSFEDPFVFLLHSNVDRLWAMWQTVPGQEWRLDPAQTYGNESGSIEITEDLEPWSGTVHFGSPIPPWDPADPGNQIVHKNSLHPSVVQPPCYDTLPITVELQTPSPGAPLQFNDVPESIETVRAAVFFIRACTDITLEITAGPGASFGTPLDTTVTVPYTSNQPTFGYVWVSYQGTNDGDTANGSVTIHCHETGEDWTIPIIANTIPKPTVASMLVLDKSGSMAWDSGIPGMSRLQVLKAAAPKYVYLMGDEDGIGIASFDHDAYPVMGIEVAGSLGAGVGRGNAIGHINAHDEDGGGTSIGDGLELAHGTIDPVTGYDHKALIIFSDGHETADKYISEVSSLLTEQVFAIGLGRADQLNVDTLDTLTSSTGGYLLMTGDLDINDQFRLSKYFMQIQAGVTNTDIVVDPENIVQPGAEHKIPFSLSESDFELDVIMLSPYPQAIQFHLETPDGKVITPADAGPMPAVEYVTGTGVHFYRATLPLPVDGKEVHPGTWHAVLTIDEREFRKYLSGLLHDERNTSTVGGASGGSNVPPSATHGVPYSLSVHARSNVRMQVYATATSHEPGALATLRAILTQSDLPLENMANVHVELTRPDGTMSLVKLDEIEPGIFETRTTLSMVGIYQTRFKARGKTLRGLDFTREDFRTLGVTHGGSRPHRPGDGGADREAWCRFLRCMFANEATLKLLGMDPEHAQKCLEELCAPKRENSRPAAGHHSTTASKPAGAEAASKRENQT